MPRGCGVKQAVARPRIRHDCRAALRGRRGVCQVDHAAHTRDAAVPLDDRVGAWRRRRPGLLEATQARARARPRAHAAEHLSMVKVQSGQCPSASTLPGEGVSPLGAQPLPRVLELAASKATDLAAFDRSGTCADASCESGRSPTGAPADLKGLLIGPVHLRGWLFLRALLYWIFLAGWCKPPSRPWP